MGFYGYVKANKLTSEYIIRQDMNKREEATTISREDYQRKEFNLAKSSNTEKINVRTVFEIKENNLGINMESENLERNNKTWISISNSLMKKQIDLMLQEYKTRTNLIDTITNEVIENNISGVIIDFSEVEKEHLKRFIIELTPKLREAGIDTCVVTNENVEKNDYIDIVDYIIE